MDIFFGKMPIHLVVSANFRTFATVFGGAAVR